MSAKILIFGSRLPQPSFYQNLMHKMAAHRKGQHAGTNALVVTPRPTRRIIILPSVICLPYVPSSS